MHYRLRVGRETTKNFEYRLDNIEKVIKLLLDIIYTSSHNVHPKNKSLHEIEDKKTENKIIKIWLSYPMHYIVVVALKQKTNNLRLNLVREQLVFVVNHCCWILN